MRCEALSQRKVIARLDSSSNVIIVQNSLKLWKYQP